MVQYCVSHDRLVEEVYNRICNNTSYDVVEKLCEYSSNGREGEFDVLALRGSCAHYYEIKTHRSSKSMKKARDQFQRAREAFPHMRWKFILVTNEGIERMLR